MKYDLGNRVKMYHESFDLRLRISRSSGMPMIWGLTKEAGKAYPLAYLFSTITQWQSSITVALLLSNMPRRRRRRRRRRRA